MHTLTDIAGIPLSLDDEYTDLIFDTAEVQCAASTDVPLTDIIHALLNKSLRYPEDVYSHHSRVFRRCDSEVWPEQMTYDLLFIPAGLLGIEYTKTHIFHINAAFAQVACVVHVLDGTLTVIMQRNKMKDNPFDMTTVAEDVQMVEVHAGDKAAIPAGVYYTFINAGEVPVVFARVIMQEHVVDYQSLRRENGLAYYYISKNARPELVKNSRYREVAEVKHIHVDELNDRNQYKVDSAPLYEEVKRGFVNLAQILQVAA